MDDDFEEEIYQNTTETLGRPGGEMGPPLVLQPQADQDGPDELYENVADLNVPTKKRSSEIPEEETSDLVYGNVPSKTMSPNNCDRFDKNNVASNTDGVPGNVGTLTNANLQNLKCFFHADGNKKD